MASSFPRFVFLQTSRLGNMLTYDKLIGDRRARRNGALGDATWVFFLVGEKLVDAVEVQAGGLVAEHVVDGHDDSVTDRGLDLGTRSGIVDADDRSREAIRGGVHPRDVPVVGDDGGGGDAGQPEGREERPVHDERVRGQQRARKDERKLWTAITSPVNERQGKGHDGKRKRENECKDSSRMRLGRCSSPGTTERERGSGIVLKDARTKRNPAARSANTRR